MRNVARTQWIARFDLESLLGSTLRNGMILSMGFILAGSMIQWLGKGGGMENPIHAESVLLMILSDLQQGVLTAPRVQLFMHLGISTLLLTPYLGVIASFFYFTRVEFDWRYALFTGLLLVILTVTLLTPLV